LKEKRGKIIQDVGNPKKLNKHRLQDLQKSTTFLGLLQKLFHHVPWANEPHPNGSTKKTSMKGLISLKIIS
jgi:hypothetical protein